MKKFAMYFMVGLAGILLIQACGPSEQELQQREQARLDSLERVRVMQLQQVQADSLAQIQRQAQLEEQRQQDVQERAVQFTRDGAFTVQVGSWRSETVANQQLQNWKNRGYEHAVVTKYGEEEVGDVWFRVRLGRVADRNEAEKLQNEVMQKHNAESWISRLN